MKSNPLKPIASLAIAALIGYLHDKHIWPLNSIFNEICIALVLLLGMLILKWKEDNS